MFEKLDILTQLLHQAERLNDNNIRYLPDEHKNTSLESGARCDLSYHQGYRDGIQSILSIIRIDYELERESMEDESDQMYLEHLQQRCADEYIKEGLLTGVNHMTKEECITFLKDKGVWNK
tara:strand:+ start:1264 stop:1626 length:363 start_codon:yes stop_codon:yes gene_type:complete